MIGHLLNSMKQVGPRAGPQQQQHDQQAVAAAGLQGELDPEEEYEFLEQLLQSKELNALVKAHNVILFCNQVGNANS